MNNLEALNKISKRKLKGYFKKNKTIDENVKRIIESAEFNKNEVLNILFDLGSEIQETKKDYDMAFSNLFNKFIIVGNSSIITATIIG